LSWGVIVVALGGLSALLGVLYALSDAIVAMFSILL